MIAMADRVMQEITADFLPVVPVPQGYGAVAFLRSGETITAKYLPNLCIRTENPDRPIEKAISLSYGYPEREASRLDRIARFGGRPDYISMIAENTISWSGPASDTDIAVILTAFSGLARGFIPRHFGLANLHGRNPHYKARVSNEGPDDAWHRLLGARSSVNECEGMVCDLVALCRQALKHGFDEVAARRDLERFF